MIFITNVSSLIYYNYSYLSEIGKSINNSIINNDKNDFYKNVPSIDKCFYFVHVTIYEIININLKMKSTKSKDINNWNMALIQNIKYTI